jgi:hypothetical protein
VVSRFQLAEFLTLLSQSTSVRMELKHLWLRLTHCELIEYLKDLLGVHDLPNSDWPAEDFFHSLYTVAPDS